MAEKVCSGATLSCDKGSSDAKLNVLPKTVSITSQPAANIGDHLPVINISSLGNCKITKAPCVPVTTAPWDSSSTIKIEGKTIVKKDSTLKCTIGGEITITDAGQGSVHGD